MLLPQEVRGVVNTLSTEAFATLTLTLESQSTMSSLLLNSELIGTGSFSARRIHQGSTGRMVTPNLQCPDGSFVVLLTPVKLLFPSSLGTEVFRMLTALKRTKPLGCMDAYMSRIERQRMTRKTSMRTMMANLRRHACLAINEPAAPPSSAPP